MNILNVLNINKDVNVVSFNGNPNQKLKLYSYSEKTSVCSLIFSDIIF